MQARGLKRWDKRPADETVIFRLHFEEGKKP